MKFRKIFKKKNERKERKIKCKILTTERKKDKL